MLDERQISALTSIGFAGTLAVAAANIFHLNCFANFRLDPVDISTALKIHLPLYALESLILLPAYFPDGQAAQHDDSSGSSSSTQEGGADAGADQAGNISPQQDRTPAIPSISPALVQAVLDITQPSGSAPAQLSPLEQLRISLALYQMTYVGNAATAGPQSPRALAVELPLIALRELSKEVLQRGLLLTGLAQALLDRATESGTGDVITLSALSSEPVPTSLLASYAAAALVTVLFVPAALRQASGASMAIAGNMVVLYGLTDEFRQIESQAVKEYKALEAGEAAARSFPVASATVLSAVRNMLAVLAANASYVATGNLAASYVSGLVSNALLLAYSRMK